METFRQVLKCKTIREAFDTISERFYSIAAMITILISGSVPMYLFVSGWFDEKAYLGITASVLLYISGIFTVMLGIMYLVNYHYKHKGAKNFLLRHKIFFIAVAIIVWSVISTCLNGLNEETIWGKSIQCEGILMYVCYGLIFCCAALIRDRKHKRIVLNWICIQAGIIAIFFFVQEMLDINMLTFDNCGNNWRSAVFPQFNHYGYFLVVTGLIMSGMLLTEKKLVLKIMYAVGIALTSWALIWNTTFGAFLAILFGFAMLVVIFSLCKGRFDFTSLIPLGIFTAVLIVMVITAQTDVLGEFSKLGSDVENIASGSENAGAAGTNRWALWVSTWDCITQKPIIGWGPNGIADIIREAGGAGRTHNEFLQFTAFFGVPWLVMYLALIFAVYLKGLKYRKTLSLEAAVALVAAFGYLVSSFTGVSLYSTAPMLYILLGLGVHHVSENCTGTAEITSGQSGD